MVTCTGKSVIPISFEVYQKFMNSVVPPNKLAEFNIKLDARSNAKSIFAKLEGHDLTIYTSVITKFGGMKFPEVADAESLLMLFTIYGVKKAGAGVNFEVKNTDAGIAELKVDPDFNALSGQLHFFMEKFRPLNDQAISVPSMFEQDVQQSVSVQVSTVAVENAGKLSVSSDTVQVKEDLVQEQKTKKIGVSPFKDVPLGDTPKISVPADLDLRMV